MAQETKNPLEEIKNLESKVKKDMAVESERVQKLLDDYRNEKQKAFDEKMEKVRAEKKQELIDFKNSKLAEHKSESDNIVKDSGKMEAEGKGKIDSAKVKGVEAFNAYFA